MYKVANKTLKTAHKPFDIVSNENGDIGIVHEVSVNSSQPESQDQISYAVNWIIGSETKHAWWDHNDLHYHCNIFVKIAEMACHPFSTGAKSVQKLFNNIHR